MSNFIARAFQGLLGWFGYRLVRHGFIASSRFGVDPVFDMTRLLSDRAFAVHLPRQTVDCVLDVGANVGDTSLRLANAFPTATVHAFEPVSSTFAELSARTAGHPRIKAHRLAFGTSSGTLALNLFDGSVFASATSRHAMMSRKSSIGCENVPLVPLDRWCADNDIEVVDILKIDTEGFDAEVLRGASHLLGRGSIGFVYFEFFRVDHDVPGEDGGHLIDAHRVLTGFGYRPVTFYTDYISSAHTGGIFNALYASWRVPNAASDVPTH